MASLLRGLAACLALAELCRGERNEAAGVVRPHVLGVTPDGHLASAHSDHPQHGDVDGEDLRPGASAADDFSSAVEVASRSARSEGWWLTDTFFPPPPEDRRPEYTKGSKAKRTYRVMTFNVFYKNQRYTALANLIHHWLPEIVNFQEAIATSGPAIVDELNRIESHAKWILANPWKADYFWCGLTAVKSAYWELLWNKEIPLPQGNDTRGICGSLLKRKEDGVKLCVFGTHSAWQYGKPGAAVDAVKVAAPLVKECSDKHDAPAIFTGDFNTVDSESVRGALKDNTGYDWVTAAAGGFAQVHAMTSPRQTGKITQQGAVEGAHGRAGCEEKCQNEFWAWSDHPPVYADIVPP